MSKDKFKIAEILENEDLKFKNDIQFLPVKFILYGILFRYGDQQYLIADNSEKSFDGGEFVLLDKRDIKDIPESILFEPVDWRHTFHFVEIFVTGNGLILNRIGFYTCGDSDEISDEKWANVVEAKGQFISNHFAIQADNDLW